jgi:hypothetical protein
MIKRTSIYDRISEKRLAQEEAERIALEQAAAEPVIEVIEVAPPAPLQDIPSSFNFGGFNFAFPEGLAFSDISAIAHLDGEEIAISVQRRSVPEERTLAQGFAEACEELQQRYLEMRVVRQRESSLAGNPAMTLDFTFRVGHEERHGRLIGAMVPLAGRNERQWLGVSCVIDPDKPALAGWLLDFDDMLTGLSPR